MTIFIIALAVVLGTVFFLMKSGKIEDKDGNNIPDVIKEEVKEIKIKSETVKEEVNNVVEVIKEIVDQTKDTTEIPKPKKRKYKKPVKK